MRTDAKDLALDLFLRNTRRCRSPFLEKSKETTCEDGPSTSNERRASGFPEQLKETIREGGPSWNPGMASQGSVAMKVYNNELIHRIEELREKKEKIKKVIQLEEEEQENIKRELAALNKRLAVIDHSLFRKYVYVEEYDKTIQEVESAYSKILESSQALLHVLKTENSNQVPQNAS